MLDGEFFEELFEAFLALFWALFDDFEDGEDVFFDIHIAKNRGFLRKIANAEAGALIHRHFADFKRINENMARSRRN